MVSIENLSFGYKKNKPLYKNLSLSLESGSIYGLLGKNGAGKSTLLKNLIGLLFPSNGKISVSFHARSKNDLTISITDVRGKEVFSDKQNDFSGEYSNQVDLSNKGKGTYFIKITHGDDSITKKIMVE